jgi:regulatory protein
MQTRRAPRRLSPDALWDYALRLLAQRPYSAAELKHKLLPRADSAASAGSVINKLREYGLADDAKFSEAFASARLQNKGFGQIRVLHDLRAKRVSAAVAEKAIQKTFSGTEEADLARRYLERKYRGKNLPELLREEKQLAAAYRRLRTAGFSGRVALSVLKMYSAKALEWEDLPEE